MKKMEIEQMESIEGGTASVGSIICGGGFLGYGSIVTYAFALGGVSAGATTLIGLGIGVVGLAVCSLA